MKVIRNLIADYLDTGTEAVPVFSLMGAGFNSLDESPSPKVEKKAYINDKSTSGNVVGYENSFAYDTDFISDDAVVQKLYGTARNQEVGTDAEMSYVRVDLYDPVMVGEVVTANTFHARKFKVANEVSGITGAGTETIQIKGTLHQVGDFVEGTFNTSTKAFAVAVEV